MKSFNFFKKALLVVAALTISLGFASCSDDEDNDPKGPTGLVTPEIKKLPSVITVTQADPEDGVITYTYEYNNNNQPTKITASNSLGTNPDVYTFSYSADGKVSSVAQKDNYETWTYTFSYDEKAGTVTITDKYDTDKIYVDKDGYPISYKENDLNYVNIEYGNFRNITKIFSSYSYDDHNDKEVVGTAEYNCSYSSIYSPFLNINLPAWLISGVGEDTMPEIIEEDEGGIVIGSHLPASGKIIYKEPTYEEGSEYTYKVGKSEENYPTEFTISSIYSENGVKETVPSVISYKITYVDAK